MTVQKNREYQTYVPVSSGPGSFPGLPIQDLYPAFTVRAFGSERHLGDSRST